MPPPPTIRISGNRHRKSDIVFKLHSTRSGPDNAPPPMRRRALETCTRPTPHPTKYSINDMSVSCGNLTVTSHRLVTRDRTSPDGIPTISVFGQPRFNSSRVPSGGTDNRCSQSPSVTAARDQIALCSKLTPSTPGFLKPISFRHPDFKGRRVLIAFQSRPGLRSSV